MEPGDSNEANRNVIAQANFRLSFGVLVAVLVVRPLRDLAHRRPGGAHQRAPP